MHFVPEPSRILFQSILISTAIITACASLRADDPMKREASSQRPKALPCEWNQELLEVGPTVNEEIWGAGSHVFDLDRDGTLELIVQDLDHGLTVFNAKGKKTEKIHFGQVPFEGAFVEFLPLRHQNAVFWLVTYQPKTAMGMHEGLALYDRLGKLQWSYKPELPENHHAQILFTSADVSGDDAPEVLVATRVYSMIPDGDFAWQDQQFCYITIMDLKGTRICQRPVPHDIHELKVIPATEVTGKPVLVCLEEGSIHYYALRSSPSGTVRAEADQKAAWGPQQILDDSARQYAKLTTYRDSGTVTVPMEGAMGSLSVDFKTVFKAPSRLRFDWSMATGFGFSFGGTLVGNGTETYVTLGSDEDSYYRFDRLEMGIAAATGVSSASAYYVPSLLLGDRLKGMFDFKLLSDLRRHTDSQVGGVTCYVVSGSLANHNRYTFWIGTADLLIRKVSTGYGINGTPLPNQLNSTEVHLNIRVDQEIDDNEFVFTPPKGAKMIDRPFDDIEAQEQNRLGNE